MGFNTFRPDGHSPSGSPVSQHGAKPRARDGRPAQKQSPCAAGEWLCPFCSKLVGKARAAAHLQTLACQLRAHEREQEVLRKVHLQEKEAADAEASKRNKNDGREWSAIQAWAQTALNSKPVEETTKNCGREWPSEPEAETGGDEVISKRMTTIYEVERKSVSWNMPPLARQLPNSRLAKNLGSSPPSSCRQPSQDHVLPKLSGQTLKAAVSSAPSFLGWRLESIFR
jgi:hypothetical protein